MYHIEGWKAVIIAEPQEHDVKGFVSDKKKKEEMYYSKWEEGTPSMPGAPAKALYFCTDELTYLVQWLEFVELVEKREEKDRRKLFGERLGDASYYPLEVPVYWQLSGKDYYRKLCKAEEKEKERNGGSTTGNGEVVTSPSSRRTVPKGYCCAFTFLDEILGYLYSNGKLRVPLNLFSRQNFNSQMKWWNREWPGRFIRVSA